METIPITEASRRGISSLVSSAEQDNEIALSRHGRVVAEVVSSHTMDQLRSDQSLLRDAALVIARVMTDSGSRTELNEALHEFGLNRAELEAELDAELGSKTDLS